MTAARRYSIANAKWFFGPRDANNLISLVSFTFAVRRHLSRLASAPFSSFRSTQFGWAPSALFAVCNACIATKHNT